MERDTAFIKSKSLKILNLINLLDYCDDLQNVPADEEDMEMEKCQLLYDIELAHAQITNKNATYGDTVGVHANGSDSSGYVENPMDSITEEDFESTYGFRKQTVLNIFNDIAYGWTNRTQRGCPKSPMHSLLVTMNYLVNGTLAATTTSNCPPPMSQSTFSRTLAKVTELIAEMRSRFIKLPTRKHEQESIKRKFKIASDFPLVVGCIGSTHIAIRTPSKMIWDDYLNEDGYHSYRFSAICGPELEFYEVTSRWPGASNENNIFHLSEFNQLLETNGGTSVALANNRYACTDYVMTPVENANTVSSLRYNEAHVATYNFPQAVALLKRRFQCLRTVLKFKDGGCDTNAKLLLMFSCLSHLWLFPFFFSFADTIQSIIVACAVLHNIAIAGDEPMPALNIEIEPIRCVSSNRAAAQPLRNGRGSSISSRESFILEHFSD